jgi:SNF2 family DNA or RNA helicase
VVDLKPEVWTGDVKWPQLDNPPFSSEDVALVLSESKDGTTVQVPAHIAKYLRTYQREGVRFLYDKYSQDTGCILGDDMGLGKTTQTTAFLIAILGKHGTSADICTTTEHARKQGKKRPVLICCPASIMNQWMSELLVWSFFHVRICAGPNKDAIVDMALHGEIEIIILSFETYRVMSGRLNPVDWEIVIFDEAHKVKNIKSQLSQAANCLKCKRRVGLTGTLLQNEMKVVACIQTPPPQPSNLNPQPSTLNPQPSTLNPQPSTLNPQPSTLNLQPSTFNPKP